jgi:sensor histidine kinase YesM
MKVVNIKAYFHLISKRELIFWAIGTIMFSYYIFNFLIMWINYHQTLRGQAFGLAGVVGGGFGAVGGLAYMIKSSEAKIVEKKNMAQSITIAQQLDHYKLVQKKDEETRNFRHDIKMQLLAVQGAITTDKIQEASEQVSNLIGVLQDIRSRAGTTTGSDSINANLYFLKREYPTVKCEWEGQIPPNIIMSRQLRNCESPDVTYFLNDEK